ncbi:hypothetical protein [Bacillus sonorensis]|uniref:hypothetical protein n=1 Tax=Bacillus sonorensis TaxID=119858 RepID=UPI002DBBA2DD|nr:hypothetical protein [Bacillus sonorensis]MEC0341915.1 hypothetical protein [Bacillus sonorensis]MEC0457399.1 hypothetical protein [Bacillus sonorensis]MEC0530806.1 hypothetical protein [Bacillus sonorensis]
MESNLPEKFHEAQISEKAMEDLISLFFPKIYKCLNQTNKQEREDLFQELCLDTFLCIKSFNADQLMGFFELKESIENSYSENKNDGCILPIKKAFR